MGEIVLVIAPLFIVLGVGVAAGFSARFRSAQAGLQAFVFTFALPAFLFSALAQTPLADGVPWVFAAVSLVLPGVIAAAVYGCGEFVRRRRPGSGEAVPSGALALAATYGNVGYLGVPIALSVIGPSAALAAALGQMLHNMLFMLGYPLLISIRGGAGSGSTVRGGRPGMRAWWVFKRAVLVNPVVLGAAAGAGISALRIEVPPVVLQSVDLLGQAAVPVAMFAVGLSIKPALAGMRSGSVPLGVVVLASAIKLLMVPCATLAALLLVGGDMASSWIVAAVIMAAVPVSSTASILAAEYDGDTRLTSAVTLVTSVAAVLTLPAMIALAGA